MSEQPEALRLSDELAAIVERPRATDYGYVVIHAQTVSRAAAELIGLHRMNAELLEALQALRSRLIECAGNDAISARDAYDSFYQEMVDSAISRALGQ